MKFAQSEGTQRAVIAIAAAALITLLVWGSWMIVAFVIGAIGWALSSIGGFFQSMMNSMTSVREIVFWVGLGSGVLLAGLLGFNISLERIRNRFRRSRPVSDNP